MHDRLYEYAAAEGYGAEPPGELADVAAHLAECAECRALLAELRELLGPAMAHDLPQAAAYPAPDLSFLPAQRATPTARPWHLDELGRLVVRFGAELLASLRQPGLAGVLRGRLICRYTQPLADDSPAGVTIEVFAEDTAQSVGRVSVSVELPGRDVLDMAGCRVTLTLGEATWEGETDEAGCAEFVPVPLAGLAEMRVAITLRDRSA